MSKLSVFNFLQYLDADDNLQQEVKYLTEIAPTDISKIVELARTKTDIDLFLPVSVYSLENSSTGKLNYGNDSKIRRD